MLGFPTVLTALYSVFISLTLVTKDRVLLLPQFRIRFLKELYKYKYK